METLAPPPPLYGSLTFCHSSSNAHPAIKLEDQKKPPYSLINQLKMIEVLVADNYRLNSPLLKISGLKLCNLA